MRRFDLAGSTLRHWPPSGVGGSLPTDAASGWCWRQRLTRSRSRPEVAVANELSGVRSPKMARIEAALFVADGAISLKRLVQIATLVDVREAQELIDSLNEMYDAEGSAFRVERVASGYQLLTLSSLSPWLDRVHHRQARLKLSGPMMETLAIIAYRQPCTRADVEAVRGVQSAEIIKQLMERGLVRITGEDTSLGRPYLYGTTRLFLETFGLTNLNQLPMAEDLRKPATALRVEADADHGEEESALQEKQDQESAAA